MHIIPAINTTSFEDAKQKLETIFTFLPEGELVHLDIVDGVFAPNVTWGSPEELIRLTTTKIPASAGMTVGEVKFELHLMVQNPEAVIDAWLRTELVKRVVVHLEVMTDPVYILEKCTRFGAEAMLAINPDTEVERLLAHKDDFKYMQILAVYPGLAGQKFQPQIIDKIKFLKTHAPNVTIEVDGGINPETAKHCKDAGASLFVSASYVLSNENPKDAFEKLVDATY